MKAILHTKFGPPDELQLKEVEKPVPKDNEVLIVLYTWTKWVECIVSIAIGHINSE